MASNSKEWKHAKWVWKTTFFAFVTGRERERKIGKKIKNKNNLTIFFVFLVHDHLIQTHMMEANAITTGTRLHLSPKHELRTFMKPFTFHSAAINNLASKSLINDRGLVHRIWGFDYDE